MCICKYACVYMYIYAASDEAAEFPVFEKIIEESKQLNPTSHLLIHIEGELCRSNGKSNLF